MYGAGLCLMECLRQRVQDINFARNEITVCDGKGGKDRVTMLPESLKRLLQRHLRRVKTVHERDLAAAMHLLEAKYDKGNCDFDADCPIGFLLSQEI